MESVLSSVVFERVIPKIEAAQKKRENLSKNPDAGWIPRGPSRLRVIDVACGDVVADISISGFK